MIFTIELAASVLVGLFLGAIIGSLLEKNGEDIW